MLVKKRIAALTFTCVILLSLMISVSAATPKRVAYIVGGALGDQAYLDSGQEGMDRIKSEFGVKTTTLECNYDAARYPQALHSAVQWNADVIFIFSHGFEDLLEQYADKYPDKIWVNLDTIVTNEKNTITSAIFVEEEVAFMAGVTAALLTTDTSIPGVNPDKVIGAVGGDDDPIIRAFIFGYENGAHYIDKDVEIKSVFAGVWNDPVRGKQAAKQLYSQGADVVFQIAALTGAGVLEAAKDEGKYAIGVDGNQNGLQPGHVVTSALKNVGDVIYDIHKTILNDTYEPGVIKAYGLKEGGVGLAIDEHTKGILPEKMIQQILEIEDKIRRGELNVERYPHKRYE
ncbi:MAG TPA: BMP family ABC transporter substrate-binding protein [Clostridiaceae bacterium]|nr:BMP family ABC transporter substrate-binding protein [Clostridiaceae bacterium]